MAGSRVFVQEGIYDEFIKKLAEKAKTWKVGDPFDPSTRHGPQVCISTTNSKIAVHIRYIEEYDRNKTAILEVELAYLF